MLHAFCGKIASGKSTFAARIAEETRGLLLSEDMLLATLYPEEMQTPTDFRERTARLESALAPLLQAFLASGTVLVLDFHANTKDRRRWIAEFADRVGAPRLLHWLDVPSDVCRKRLAARNAVGSHAFVVTGAHFDIVTSHFEAPSSDEGWQLRKSDQPKL